MPTSGPRKRGPNPTSTPSSNAPQPSKGAKTEDPTSPRRDEVDKAILRAAEDAGRVTSTCPLPRGLAVSDVIRMFDVERSEARTRLRRLCESGALVRSGQSHAARYFTDTPEYHAAQGVRQALIEFGQMAGDKGFTRVEFLREFPFPKSAIYSAVLALVRGRKMATRGRTNAQRYYLREFAPPRTRKQTRKVT